MRLSMLLLLTFGGLLLFTYPDLLAAAAITGLGAVVAVAWYLLTHHRRIAITVDAEAITRIEPKDSVRIRWVDITEVTAGEALLPHRDGDLPLRFALVRGLGTRRIAFADTTIIENQQVTVGAPGPTPITPVANADVLLGLVADRVEESGILDAIAEPTQPDLAEEEAAEVGEEEAPEAEGTEEETPKAKPRRRIGVGLFALLVKLGAKLIKPIAGLFKGTQGVLAVASAGALALFFSWEGVVAIMAALLVHELGHVWAMKRSGMKVRGIYFIPIVGAATVPDDTWTSRRQQAFVALGGPLFGLGFTLVPVVFIAATGTSYPLAAVVAIAGAVLNLFNLLPINPLDGGRVLSAVGYSINSRVGMLLSLGTICIGAGICAWAGLHLVALLLCLGLAELAVERASAARFRELAFATDPARLGVSQLFKLRLLTRPAFPEPTESKLRDVELQKLGRQEKQAHITPMTGKQMALWAGVYLLLTAALSGVFVWMILLHDDLGALIELFR